MTRFLLVLFAALFMGAAGVYAQDTQTATTAASTSIGGAEVKLLEAVFTGNLGLLLGLGIAIMGIFKFSQGDTGAGITLIVVGVLITLLPGVFNGMRAVVCPIATALGGHCGTG